MVGTLHADRMSPMFKMDDTSQGVEKLANDEVKQLMKIIQSLRHLGIEAKDLPFPKLCVTGDQSTGKSSLIEGISEIRVPRGSGTCTRCPVEINLSEDASQNALWKCEIFLSQRYAFDTRARKLQATKAKPLGPWIEKELETFHFASLRSKEQVSDALKWAQLATLNPGSNFEAYKLERNHSTPDTLQVPFSPNVVRMDISGPGLLNLSFYDLPGVVSQDKDDYVPQLVENLVKEYISAENCIILHTLTMNHDAANSIAAGIIHAANADSRTVGVLTKPDLFISDSMEQWRDILDGRMFPRELGYYVVKNNARVDVDHATARVEEENFFEMTPPFSSELWAHSRRFGTPKLQKALSTMLAKQIKASLPKLITEIASKLDAKQSRIAALPKPPEGNVAGVVEARICDLTRKITNEIGGGSLECETFFFTQWLEKSKRFGDLLVCSRPLIVRPPELIPPPLPRDSAEGSATPSRSSGPIEAMVISDDEGDEPTPKRPRQNGTPMSGQKRSFRGEGPGSPKRPALGDRIRRREGFIEAQQYNKRFKMDDIQDKLRKLDAGAGSAGHPKIIERMFHESITHWQDLTQRLLIETRSLCMTHLGCWLKSIFEEWSTTALYQRVQESTDAFLARAFEAEREFLESLCAMERRKLLVTDVEEDSWNEHEILTSLQEVSRGWRKELEIAQRLRSGKKLGPADMKDIMDEIMGQPDPYNAELRALAKVRSHYHSSATQFARYAALSICTRLFESLREQLPNNIREALGLMQDNANDICKQLLAVDPVVEAERQRLIRDEKALRAGHEQLSGLLGPSLLSTNQSPLTYRSGIANGNGSMNGNGVHGNGNHVNGAQAGPSIWVRAN